MISRPGLQWGVLLTALALSVAACAPAAPAPAVTSPEPALEPPGDAAANPNTPTPEPDVAVEVPEKLMFSTTTVVDGTEFDASTLAGKDTILWFWAPWCPTCQAESGGIAEAARELPDGVTLIGVAGRADVADMQGFVTDYGVGGFEHLVDADGSIWERFDVPYQPAYAFINDDGEIRTVVGALGKSGVLEAAEELAAS
jgi:thiol-disulfide isomerase/thioredoxin